MPTAIAINATPETEEVAANGFGLSEEQMALLETVEPEVQADEGKVENRELATEGDEEPVVEANEEEPTADPEATTEGDEEPVAEASEEEAQAEPEAEPKNGYEKRIHKLTAQKHEALTRAERAEADLVETRAKLEEAVKAPAPVTPIGPNPEDADAEFVAARESAEKLGKTERNLRGMQARLGNDAEGVLAFLQEKKFLPAEATTQDAANFVFQHLDNVQEQLGEARVKMVVRKTEAQRNVAAQRQHWETVASQAHASWMGKEGNQVNTNYQQMRKALAAYENHPGYAVIVADAALGRTIREQREAMAKTQAKAGKAAETADGKPKAVTAAKLPGAVTGATSRPNGKVDPKAAKTQAALDKGDINSVANVL